MIRRKTQHIKNRRRRKLIPLQRVPAQTRIPISDLPVCANCGRPLSRIPSYLAALAANRGAFQCERCFYTGTGRRPGQSVISSERMRWLEEFTSGGTSSPMPVEAESEAD